MGNRSNRWAFLEGIGGKVMGATIVRATDWKYSIVQRMCETGAVTVGDCCS